MKRTELLRELLASAAEALTVEEIARRTGAHSETVLTEITKAQIAGIPVCCRDGRYWITDDPDELMQTAGDLNATARPMLRAAKHLRQTAERIRQEGRNAHEHDTGNS